MSDGYIYWIQAVPDGLVKVGFSRNVAQRYKNLQQYCPVQLTLRGTRRGSLQDERGYHEALREHRSHEALREHRSHGEWFRPVKEVFEPLTRRFPIGVVTLLVASPKPEVEAVPAPFVPRVLLNGVEKALRQGLMCSGLESFPEEVDPFVTGLVTGRFLAEQITSKDGAQNGTTT